MVTAKQVKEARLELERLEYEYYQYVPPCLNPNCAYNRPDEKYSKCSKNSAVELVEECEEYKPERPYERKYEKNENGCFCESLIRKSTSYYCTKCNSRHFRSRSAIYHIVETTDVNKRS